MTIVRPASFILGLLLFAVPCFAQTVDSTEEAFAVSQGGDVPPYVVPVLRLVSKTHVEPTTGLVLSESGLVLVPAGFASAGDEIIVLDGGTDIISNGRTARIEKNFPMDGLQVLSVYGLERRGAPFADTELADGDEVRLTAFPPAEQIAEGAQPLDITTRVTVFGENNAPAVSGETPLPNVTGPLLDACGNVAAFSIAHDIQTMETSPGTRYQWRNTLREVLDRLGVRPSPSACSEAVAPPAETEEALPTPVEQAAPEPPVEEIADESEPEPAGIEEEEPQPQETLELEILPPIESDGEEPAIEPLSERPVEEPASGSIWLILAAAFILAGLALHWWRKSAMQAEEEAAPVSVPPPSSEEEPERPEPVLDSLLVLTGHTGPEKTFEVSCPVAGLAVNAIIGRGNADLVIDSPAVSRQHAALNGTSEALTITDLGSNNGTRINGVPCLEGEIMYVKTGDTVMLGDARFTIEIRPAREEA